MWCKIAYCKMISFNNFMKFIHSKEKTRLQSTLISSRSAIANCLYSLVITLGITHTFHLSQVLHFTIELGTYFIRLY